LFAEIIDDAEATAQYIPGFIAASEIVIAVTMKKSPWLKKISGRMGNATTARGETSS